MKAIIHTKFGPPEILQLQEIEKPTPLDDQVLIKVSAASVNALDYRSLRGKPYFARLLGFGILRPKKKVLGVDVAGRVEAIGRNVKLFRPGDEVFGTAGGAAGGSFAEYACAREVRLALKPANKSFEQAAAVPIAGLTALQGLRDRGQIQPGQKVLIDGASGGVSTFAVQIAKSFGAEVTAVCRTRNVSMARSIGADHVIDSTQEDFTKNKQRYDLILAANGYHHSIFAYKRALNPKGIYVTAGGSISLFLQTILLGPLISKTGSKKMAGFIAEINRKDLDFMKGLLETGKVVPIIDKRYPLNQTAEAVRYMEEAHAQGKVVITVAQ